MPQLRACVHGKLSNPRAASDAEFERARQQCGMAIVRPCVMREEQKQAARTPAPAAPKDDTNVTPQSVAPIRPAFVAPPRTIADITAILDSEKPDEAKIAARKAAADVAPPQNVSAAKLAQFYYDRGNATSAPCSQQGGPSRRIASARGRKRRDRVPATRPYSAICRAPVPSSRRRERRNVAGYVWSYGAPTSPASGAP